MNAKPSKSKASANPKEVKIRAFPTDRRKTRKTPSTWLLFTLSLALVAGGVIQRWGVQLQPSLEPVAQEIAALGFGSSELLLGGVLLLGIALVSRQLRVHTATLLTPGAIEEALTELGADMAEFRNKLYELGNDQVDLRSRLMRTQAAADEYYRSDRTDEIIQATFRVAGSLDTLHAKLDHRMTDGNAAVLHGLQEVSHLVEASRDFLQETLEDSHQKTNAISDDLRALLRERAALTLGAAQLVHAAVPVAEQAVAQPAAPAPQAAAPQVGLQSSMLGEPHDAAQWLRSRGEDEEEEVEETASVVEHEEGEDLETNTWMDELDADGFPEETEDTEVETGEQVELDEDSELRMASVPEAAQQVTSDAQQTKLGLLDRLHEEEPAESAPAAYAAPEPTLDPLAGRFPQPPSPLNSPRLPRFEPRPPMPAPAAPAAHRGEPLPPLGPGVGAPPSPPSLLQVRFDHPPQPPQGHAARVEPQEADGTTVVRLDEPFPLLPGMPPPTRRAEAEEAS